MYRLVSRVGRPEAETAVAWDGTATRTAYRRTHGPHHPMLQA
jgi:hypothetical protein